MNLTWKTKNTCLCWLYPLRNFISLFSTISFATFTFTAGQLYCRCMCASGTSLCLTLWIEKHSHLTLWWFGYTRLPAGFYRFTPMACMSYPAKPHRHTSYPCRMHVTMKKLAKTWDYKNKHNPESHSWNSAIEQTRMNLLSETFDYSSSLEIPKQ